MKVQPNMPRTCMEVLHMPLVEMHFGKGALTREQKADLSRKVTDLLVKERSSCNTILS